jgi:hypothetical protein
MICYQISYKHALNHYAWRLDTLDRSQTPLGWDDDLELSKVPLAHAQYQLAMFAAHLAEGNTIYCQSIKLAAIKA